MWNFNERNEDQMNTPKEDTRNRPSGGLPYFIISKNVTNGNTGRIIGKKV